MNRSSATSTGTFAGFAALLVGIGLGRFAYPPLIPALVKERWFSAAQADYLASTAMAGYLVGAFFAGHRLWKPGPSVTIRTSMIVASASFVTCAAPLSFSWFFLWRLLAGIAAGFLMVTAVPGIIARTPPEERGRASGIIFTGIGAGIAAAGAFVPVLARSSLAGAWLGIGIASLVLTIAVWRYWPRLAAPLADQLTDSGSVRFGLAIALLIAAYLRSRRWICAPLCVLGRFYRSRTAPRLDFRRPVLGSDGICGGCGTDDCRLGSGSCGIFP